MCEQGRGEGKGQEISKTNHLGTLNLELVLSSSRSVGKKRDRGRGWAVQSRAAVKGRERGIVGHEVMRLGQGFRKVRGHT